MDGHEWNYLVGGSIKPLETGNMFSNEPGIYIFGEFGIRLEDEMLITKPAPKLLWPQAESLAEDFLIYIQEHKAEFEILLIGNIASLQSCVKFYK